MKTPTLKRHVSGRAYTRFKGKCTYFGKFGTEEAQQRFQQWLADMDFVEDKFQHVSLLLLASKFMDHAKVHYRKNGVPTGEANNVRLAMRTACTMYGNSRVSEFGPKRLKAVRDQMIQDGLCRNTVNARIRRIRHVFKWGVSEQFVPVSVLIGLQTVQGLEAGRTSARETDPVEPVAELDIIAVEPFVSRPVWGLIQFMLLTGARPGEAVRLRLCDIDAESDVWVYRPSQHKTEHHGKSRRILIGPRAQDIVKQLAGSD
ncbi:MAG: site-specific integrase [Fuerstiella sp.]